MKTFPLIALAALLFTGCASLPVPSETALDRAEKTAFLVSSNAVRIDLRENPKHRTLIQASSDVLAGEIESGRLTVASLGRIVMTLPIGGDALRVVDGAVLVFDTVDWLWGTPAIDAVALRIGKGILRGTRGALDAPATRAAVLTPPASKALPAPSQANTRPLR